MNIKERYQTKLESLPPSGGGGCHGALLGAANCGVMAGIKDEQIFNDLHDHVHGTRPISDQEINAAIARARMDHDPSGQPAGTFRSLAAKPRPKVKSEYLQALIKEGLGFDVSALLSRSKVQIDETMGDGLLLLETLYKPDDALFLGERTSTRVRSVSEWIKLIEKFGSRSLPHIIPNPLTGRRHEKAGGGLSYRCDNAVKDFRYAMAEFDNLSRADQLAFWAAVPLPVAALIDSGGKSIHGWIKLPAGVRTADDWEQTVEINLYGKLLIPLGVDPACKNEARLSRFPGHYREEKDAFQELLYLDPDPSSQPIMKT